MTWFVMALLLVSMMPIHRRAGQVRKQSINRKSRGGQPSALSPVTVHAYKEVFIVSPSVSNVKGICPAGIRNRLHHCLWQPLLHTIAN